ncbi:hypothetical protein ACLOJK_002858 [Asimina triloba]
MDFLDDAINNVVVPVARSKMKERIGISFEQVCLINLVRSKCCVHSTFKYGVLQAKKLLRDETDATEAKGRRRSIVYKSAVVVLEDVSFVCSVDFFCIYRADFECGIYSAFEHGPFKVREHLADGHWAFDYPVICSARCIVYLGAEIPSEDECLVLLLRSKSTVYSVLCKGSASEGGIATGNREWSVRHAVACRMRSVVQQHVLVAHALSYHWVTLENACRFCRA